MSDGIIKLGGPTRKRRPAFRGVVMQDVSHGRERVRVWPTKRGRPKDEGTRQRNDDFRQACQACRYWDPRNIIAVDEMRKGTPILIRDVQIMMMYNRFASFILPDGTEIFPVAARGDVSKSLDTISPLPGSMLYRAEEGWRYIAPPDDSGLLLRSGTDPLVPEWAAADTPVHGFWYWNPPAAAAFTNFRSGDATAATATDDLDIGLSVDSGNMVTGPINRCALQSLAAANVDWTLIAHLVPTLLPGNFNGAYLVALENSTNKWFGAGWLYNGSMLMSCRSGVGLASTGTARLENNAGIAPMHFRLRHVEATRIMTAAVSADGKKWTQLFSIADTTAFTARADRIGVMFVLQNANAVPLHLAVDRWVFSTP